MQTTTMPTTLDYWESGLQRSVFRSGGNQAWVQSDDPNIPEVFKRKFQGFSTGNVIGDNQLSCSIRPYTEIEAHDTYEPGVLRAGDIDQFKKLHLPNLVRQEVMATTTTEPALLYLIMHYSPYASAEEVTRIHHGWVLTRVYSDYRLLGVWAYNHPHSIAIMRYALPHLALGYDNFDDWIVYLGKRVEQKVY